MDGGVGVRLRRVVRAVGDVSRRLPLLGQSIGPQRQTVNNILCINPVLFSLQVYLLNKSIFYVISLSNELYNVYSMFINILHYYFMCLFL